MRGDEEGEADGRSENKTEMRRQQGTKSKIEKKKKFSATETRF